MTDAISLPWGRSFARVISAIVFLISLSVLMGWQLKLPALTSIVPAWPKMVALTAAAFGLAAVSLLFLSNASASRTGIANKVDSRISKACAALVIFIGVVGFAASLLGWNVRLDTFSIERLPAPFATSPAGTMAPATAVAFIVLGTALALARSIKFVGTYQACAILALLLGWIGFSRYVFGGEPLIPYAAMAIHTAALFLILGAAVLSLRADVGLIALFANERAAGRSVRQLVPTAIVVPLIAGWVALRAERAGWVGHEASLSLFALMSIIAFVALVWINARSLERTEREHRAAQLALTASEERTRLIVEAAFDAVVTIDRAGKITGWSAQAESLFGWPRAAALGRTIAETIIPERYREPHARGLRRYLETEEARVLNRRIELSALNRAGREFPIELAIAPIGSGEQLSFCAFVRDITERRQATDALRESQQLLQAIVDNSIAVVYVKDLTGRYLLVNRRFEEIFHLSRDTILGQTDHEIFPKEAADAFRTMDQRVAAADRPLTEEEVAPHHDGPHDYISVKAPLRDAAGQTYAIFGISTDITDRKRAEERLRAQLDRLNLLDRTTRAIGERQDLPSIFQVVIRSLEDRLPIDFGCVCQYEPAQRSLSITCVGAKSQVLAAQLGMTERARIEIDENGLARCIRGELVCEPDIRDSAFPFPMRLARGGLRSLVLAPLVVESSVFGVLITSRREIGSFTSSDCEFLRQLSQHVALAAHQTQLHGALQRAYDDLRQTQQAVMQQERLRSLGQMASGIAHDINNALSPAALYAQALLEQDPTLNERARTYLVTIQRSIEDVASTIARMREFYRPRDPELSFGPVDLNRTLQHVADLTRVRWSDMPQEHGIVIRMQSDLDTTLPAIAGVESEIRDAITNLVLNAVDAMPNGGTITLRSRAGSPGGSEARNAEHSTHAWVAVSDTGAGMSPEVRSHCMEPFFSTKGERGTGLGLAMVYGMVQRHSADLQIESKAGVGTTMRLVFPITTVSAVAQQQATVQSVGSLRLLVVDDDPLLLESMQATLTHDGHTIVVADGGQAGIDTFVAAQRRGESFSAVMTDLGMPNIDGRTVAAAIKSRSPETPVILLTGWGYRLRDDNDLPENVDRVLSKPPKLAELRVALAELTTERVHRSQ